MSAPTPIRASVRMNPFLPIEATEGRTLYYLKTTLPSIHDIAISGPFHTIEAVFPNLIIRMNETEAGMAEFERVAEDGRLINQFCRLSAPLTADASKSIIIELLRVENPFMASRLPGPAWNVVYAEPWGEGAAALRSGMGSGMAVKEMDILGCFPGVGAAERFARRVLREKAEGWDGGEARVVVPPRVPGKEFCGAIAEMGVMLPKVLVSVEFDSGAMRFADGEVRIPS